MDYFVSSELFEAPTKEKTEKGKRKRRGVKGGVGGGGDGGWMSEDANQERYSERLYMMRGLTTAFHRPPTPPPQPLRKDPYPSAVLRVHARDHASTMVDLQLGS